MSKYFFITCDILAAVEDTLEPISDLLSTGVKGVAAVTVPNKGKAGILWIRVFENTVVPLSLSFEYCPRSKNLPRYQPPRPTLVRVTRLNVIRLAPLISFVLFHFVIIPLAKSTTWCGWTNQLREAWERPYLWLMQNSQCIRLLVCSFSLTESEIKFTCRSLYCISRSGVQ